MLCSNQNRLVALIAVPFLLAISSIATAQGMGSRKSSTDPTKSAKTLDDFAVEHYIKIQGRAEIRVEPTGIRVVFAVTTKGDTPSGCREKNLAKSSLFLAALKKAGFAKEAFSTDFISMLPVYEWRIETQAGQKVATEHRVGYLMQTNVHLCAGNEAEANKAVAEAFRLEIPDIIAFDYWCKDLDVHKAKAQQKALGEAMRKAELLLAVFAEKPKAINVSEATSTAFPSSFYRSFENTYSQKFQSNYWRRNQNLPQIAATRPKNYYYAGFYGQVDVQDKAMPIHPQISVVSTVQIYYESPGKPVEKKDKSKK